jgi:hypothetical protein
MGENVSIALKKPIKGPNGAMFNAIVLREPTFDEVVAREDPYTVAVSPGGIPFVVENSDVIRSYIDLCLVEPADPALLKQADLHAARKVRQAILGFFQPDAGEPAASGNSRTRSRSRASGGRA